MITSKWYEPLTNSTADCLATQRALSFEGPWYFSCTWTYRHCQYHIITLMNIVQKIQYNLNWRTLCCETFVSSWSILCIVQFPCYFSMLSCERKCICMSQIVSEHRLISLFNVSICNKVYVTYYVCYFFKSCMEQHGVLNTLYHALDVV